MDLRAENSGSPAERTDIIIAWTFLLRQTPRREINVI